MLPIDFVLSAVYSVVHIHKLRLVNFKSGHLDAMAPFSFGKILILKLNNKEKAGS